MLELGCGNLFDMIRNPQEPFSERRVVRFFLQVVEGLKFIHSRNLVHCDLKSGNIIYGFERKLKIADFGLSHVGSKAMRGPVGTHQICAPEAFFSGYYDGKKNDVWALGILFIEMLNGRYLWKSPQKTDEDFTKFIRLISTAKMESRSQWGFVQFVLQKDPKKRPGLAQIQRHPYISGISKATPLRIAGPCRAIPYHAQSKLFGVDEPNFVVRI
ncbi:hypothetical protein L596_028979 [Steinernema carpocapsae]|nr:hypothetical protein L596_028979 [Steinernema carpocapsae]